MPPSTWRRRDDPGRRRLQLPPRLSGHGRNAAPAFALGTLLAGVAAGPACVVVCEGSPTPTTVAGVSQLGGPSGVPAVLLGPVRRPALFARRSGVDGRRAAHALRRVPEWPAGLSHLRAAGFTLVALTPDARAEDITALGRTRPCPTRVALLVGGEGDGLTAAARAAADMAVRIRWSRASTH